MQDLIMLTEAKLNALLAGSQPALILFSTGDGLRGDFLTAFKKAAAENQQIVFARMDVTPESPLAQRFEVDSKPVLIAWCGGEVVRRPRPWGTDVPLAVEMLQKVMPTQIPITEVKEATMTNQPTPIVDDKPVHVTDTTFQTEVIDYDKPVLVDFWAEWCGPCRQVAPTLEKLAKEFAGQIRIAKVDVDANPGLQQTFRIMSIPTIMLIKQRTIVFSQPGALPEAAFRDLINQLIKLEVPAKQPQPAK